MQQTTMATATRKLVSQKGTMLGVITFPAKWEERLNEGRSVHFHIYQPLRAFPAPGESEMFRRGMICSTSHELMKDAVMLAGINLEEFEMQPGCSFAPSAAYLRSIVA
jgi:hypothetical protein